MLVEGIAETQGRNRQVTMRLKLEQKNRGRGRGGAGDIFRPGKEKDYPKPVLGGHLTEDEMKGVCTVMTIRGTSLTVHAN